MTVFYWRHRLFACSTWRGGTWWIRARGRIWFLKAPWSAALFSELYGGWPTHWSWRGWRILSREVPQ